MSWIQRKSELRWFERLAVNVLKCGPIPKHVAFIMDGNRRFAKKLGVEKIEGHSKGFDKLTETLQWCLDLGIEEVTVFAFSIENFKRSKEEVDGLMELASEKFGRLLEEKDKLAEHGVCIRVIGNLRLLPAKLQKLIVQAAEITKNNRTVFLNVAIAYTSREEITQAVRQASWGLEKGLISTQDIDDELVESCLYTRHSSPVDLLVRTSGEVRLSDFLLLQTAYSAIYFTPVLWPEFQLKDLCFAVLSYQRNLPTIQKALRERNEEHLKRSKNDEDHSNRTKTFLEEMETEENRYRQFVLSQ